VVFEGENRSGLLAEEPAPVPYYPLQIIGLQGLRGLELEICGIGRSKTASAKENWKVTKAQNN
jgi:hypothetical protein